MDDTPTPVFELTRSRLKPILDRIAGEPVVWFEVSVDQVPWEGWGAKAEPILPTFTYRTRSGHEGNATVFAKRYCHPGGPMESHHYTYLEKLGAPIPRFYGALVDPDGREVLFLEHLDAVVDDDRFRKDVDQFRQFLAVTARFNTIQPPSDYLPHLRSQNWHKRLTGPAGTWRWDQKLWPAERILNRIEDGEGNGEAGDALARFCSSPAGNLGQLRTLAKRLVEPVSRMEIGFVNHDFWPEHTGWRRETGELLIFDLEYVGFGPRFFNVALFIGAPDGVLLDAPPGHYPARCQPRDELARYYLEQYVHWGGSPVPLDQFLEEIHVLWIAHRLSILGWWGDALGPMDRAWTEERKERYLEKRAGLYAELEVLLSESSRFVATRAIKP
jgi:hypothetical protein